MRTLPSVLVVSLLAVAPLAQAQPDSAVVDRLNAKAVACIESNAATVEGAQADLASAVNFLVGDLCGREVATREKYKKNSAMLRMMMQMSTSYVAADDGEGDSALTPAQKAAAQKGAEARSKAYKNARVDPETGDVVGLDTASSPALGWMGFAGSSADVVPDLRALAAERLLSARHARLGH